MEPAMFSMSTVPSGAAERCWSIVLWAAAGAARTARKSTTAGLMFVFLPRSSMLEGRREPHHATERVHLLAVGGHQHPGEVLVAGVAAEGRPHLVQGLVDHGQVHLDVREGLGRERLPAVLERGQELVGRALVLLLGGASSPGRTPASARMRRRRRSCSRQAAQEATCSSTSWNSPSDSEPSA